MEKVIVIGCSQGGFAALTQLLEPLPEDYPNPILVVQHRQRYDKSALEELLQRRVKLKVKQADEKEEINESVVYVAPPDYHLLVEKNCTFSLSSDHLVNYSRPSIDVLFETAAEAANGKVIGIILTGANSDGAAGIKLIRDRGGITIAQDPSSAECGVMPGMAIKTGKVQKILKLAEITAFLLSLYDKNKNTPCR